MLPLFDQAWLRGKVVTLIAFDLKGAFNGVNHTTLDARLREKKIPSPARAWIRSFMQDRMSSIHFDEFSTDVTPLEHAGLAQGSPHRSHPSSSLSSTRTWSIKKSTLKVAPRPTSTTTFAEWKAAPPRKTCIASKSKRYRALLNGLNEQARPFLRKRPN